MATTRPTIRVFSPNDGKPESCVLLPSVFCTPLRPDLVRIVHTNMAKNKRQAYGVSAVAGTQTSAKSWGTGRAVSRIPRVKGGGSHRNGQCAYGNMCRGGHMFNPIKTWRRLHRKTNKKAKRYAVASALAATAIPSLVTARGHEIDTVPELPLVVSDTLESVIKTKEALKTFAKLGCMDDIKKVIKSKKIRAGRGKTRNRKYKMRKGPLVIYYKEDSVQKALRNIPGVEFCHVKRLNLLKLAPGGTLGRFCIYTKSSMEYIRRLYGKTVVGSGKAASESRLKKGYRLPQPIMSNADLNRIINSDEIQSAVLPLRRNSCIKRQHKNLLKNRAAICRVNPIAKRMKLRARMEKTPGSVEHTALQKMKAQRLARVKVVAPKCRKQYKDIMDAIAEKKRAEEEKERLEAEAYMKAKGLTV